MATQLESISFKTHSANSSSVHSLTGVQISSIASFAPDQIVRNSDLVPLGYDEEWIVQRTGIRERRRASDDLALSDIAHEASKRCLDKAGVDASEVDLILCATITADTAMPSAACHLQRRLGSRAPAMDINAACAGFIFALATGAQYVKTGFSKRALIVGADLMTRTVDPQDKKTFPLFGDGGGAVLLGPGEESQGLLAYTLGSDGDGVDLLYIPAGGTREPASHQSIENRRHFVRMQGKPIFKWAVRMVSDAIRDVVHAAHLEMSDIDHFVLHQANRRILDAVGEELAIDPRRLVSNVERYGNTSAGSIPLALAEVEEAGRLHRGDRLVLCGFGAGLTWGAAVVQW